MKNFLLAALLLGIPCVGSAHEVWIERDGNGPARVYLGEPAEPMPGQGDPEFARLKAPHFLSATTGAPVRKAGYIEATLPTGDVRAWDDNVFASWGPDGRKEGVIFYARAGRTETRAALSFEFVPQASGSDRFQLVHDGKAVAATDVVVIAPDKTTRTIRTDAQGKVAVPSPKAGRYLLTVAIRDAGPHETPGGRVAVLHRITTLSFVQR